MSPPTVSVVSPLLVNATGKASFERMVREGGQVESATFSSLFDRASAVAFAYLEGDLVGVAALKCPNDSYRSRVFQNARATLASADFPLELGWIYVAPQGRGKGVVRPMLDKLLQERSGKPVYATTAADNARMHVWLDRFGFEKHGVLYAPTLNKAPIQLFVSF